MKKTARRNVKRLGFGLLGGLAVLLLVGELGGFGCAGRRNYAPVDPSPPSASDLLAGNWQGAWASRERDMGGDLRCRIEKLEDGSYLAHFDAVFARHFRNKSTVTLHVKNRADAWEFTGEEDLGFLKGGVYRYAGHSDGTDFLCEYDSKHDKGTFRMQRLPSTAASGN